MLTLKRKRCRVQLTDWIGGRSAVMCSTRPSHRTKGCNGRLRAECFKEC